MTRCPKFSAFWLFCSRVGSVAALVASCLGLDTPGHAASVTVVDRPYCNVRLDGEIAAGDLEQIQNIIAKFSDEETRPARTNDKTAGSNSVCLNSPGGDFSEALRIIEAFTSEAGPGTVVDDGDACVDVCAFVFMAGRFRYYHAVTLPIRRLHKNGRLSFSAPGAAGEGSRAAAVSTAYSAGIKAIAQLLLKSLGTEFYDRNRVVPQTLLLDILGLEPGEAVAVETVKQAGEWDIQVVGFKQPQVLTEAMLLQACRNYGGWRGELSDRDIAQPDPDREITLSDNKYRKTFEELGSRKQASCIADVFKDGSGTFHISVVVNSAGKPPYVPDPGFLAEQVTTGGGDEAKVGLSPGTPFWMILPPDTKIASLAGE